MGESIRRRGRESERASQETKRAAISRDALSDEETETIVPLEVDEPILISLRDHRG